ncbi:MAG: AAA family ATPase [Selenomonadaceae bacterium]|nr:AAA family ATPase [Selenomonadaceae bacterium]
MKIKELHLKNFRCFDELTISFSTPYTVLIGINGSGKSSILDALRIVIDDFTSSTQYDARKGSVFINSIKVHDLIKPQEYIKLQDRDAKIKTVIAGSTINKESQYPVAVNVTAEFSSGQSLSWTHELFAHSSLKNSGVNEVGTHVRDLQQRISNDERVTCPVVVYYGTRRQWDKSSGSKTPEISFLSQMNGYVNCLSAQPFNIEVMRHWFSRMLLIERKKSVPEFQAVRTAIANCYKNIVDSNELQDVKIDYDAEAEDIEIQQTFTNGKSEILPLHYLSDGAKSILAVASDIAYRMAVLNPHLLGNVTKETDGVVLIDEIDMHLHPSWQQKVVESLHKTFPNVQFILTTHSPTVLTNVPKENIRVLNAGEIYTPPVNTKGRDVNSILREIMHTEIRPSDVTEKLNAFAKAVEAEDLNSAQQILDDLREQLGDTDSEVVGAQITLDLERI